jgi:hypothetical protein
MPVTLIAYETIMALYGETFARTWFSPVSLTSRTR